MHFLYANRVHDEHLTPQQRDFARGLRVAAPACVSDGSAGIAPARKPKDFNSAQDWVTAFFEKGAEEVLGYYADTFVWEDIEFAQTITTKEELYKAFVVFNNSGPESPFGVHKFEVLTFDGGPAANLHSQRRQGGVPKDFQGEYERDYNRFGNNIYLGSDYVYDEWGYMQWIWKATHNEDFFGMPAKGKTTVTRGTTTQFYKDGKIVRCRTHWNFREFAIQLGLVPPPDEAWRNNEPLRA